MVYFLLLALVFTVSFIFLLPRSHLSSRSLAAASFTAGLVFLSIGFLTQLVLGFRLDNISAQLFYWARQMLALAWFGHALLLLLFGDKPQLRWLTYALIAGSLLSLVLVGATQVTKAEDWFQPERPIYAQIGDLLATNRPTRVGGWLLNAYGAVGLAVGAVYLLVMRAQKKWKGPSLAPLLLASGVAALLLPLAWPPQEKDAAFYLVELGGPILLYVAFSGLFSSPIKFGTKKPKRKK